jgi:hypothetical protein
MKPTKSPQGKTLSPQEQLLAAINNLAAALKGTTVFDPNTNTADPAPAQQAQQATFQYKTRTLAAGAVFSDYVVGNFFYLVSNTNANAATKLMVSFNDQATNVCPPGLEFDTNFTQINFNNSDVNPATIVYFVGNGRVNFHSTAITGAISASPAQAASGTYAAQVAVGAAAKIFTASTSCYAIYLQTNPANANPVYIGFDNTVSATKYVLALTPGQIYTMNNYNGNLYAFGTGTDQLGVSYA